jgi:hypothetical protein
MGKYCQYIGVFNILSNLNYYQYDLLYQVIPTIFYH